MKNNFKKFKTVISVILVLALVLPMSACNNKSKSSSEEISDDKIYDGVLIGGIDVSALTLEEASEKISQDIQIPENINLIFKDKERPVATSDIGVEANVDQAVEKAMSVGRTGTENERNEEIQAVLSQPVNISLEFSCDKSKLRDILSDIKDETDLLEGDSKFNMDIDKTADKVTSSLQSGVFEDIEPVSGDVIEVEKTLIGSFSTAFSASDVNRNENLRVACEKINGTVLQPGDIFDMNELLGPQTSANGYKNAGVIENGKIVSAIAGGVCQVTTTMYNAAIFAELKIVERHNHSLMVGYVPLGRDAAVAGTYKNLRFQNDTDYPVYIESYIDNYNVVCNVYGQEIHDSNHSVDFERVWISTIQKPAEKVTIDNNMYEDERVVTYTGKTGAKIDTYKLVYDNEELVSRTWFSSSTYVATADEVTVGSKKREPVKEEQPPVIGGDEIPAETNEQQEPDPILPPLPEETEQPKEPETVQPTQTVQPEVTPEVDSSNLKSEDTVNSDDSSNSDSDENVKMSDDGLSIIVER